MAAPTVVTTSSGGDAPAVGGLFEGLSFFLVMRLPQRSGFIDKIHANGGRVVKLEAHADYIIADHMRKESPPGSISFNFIDRAIRDGQLPDPENHRAGPAVGVVRPVASGLPTRSTRTPFTAEDDLILWDWVEDSKRGVVKIRGNEIYKQLEAANPRHTFQSWRDRYLKKLLVSPPPGRPRQQSTAAPAVNSPSRDKAANREPEVETTTANDHTDDTEAAPTNEDVDGADDFKANEGNLVAFRKDPFGHLLAMADDVENIHPDRLAEAWEVFAQVYTDKDATGWRQYYESDVRPLYLTQKQGQTAGESGETGKDLRNGEHVEGEAERLQNGGGHNHGGRVDADGENEQERSLQPSGSQDTPQQRHVQRQQSHDRNEPLPEKPEKYQHGEDENEEEKGDDENDEDEDYKSAEEGKLQAPRTVATEPQISREDQTTSAPSNQPADNIRKRTVESLRSPERRNNKRQKVVPESPDAGVEQRRKASHAPTGPPVSTKPRNEVVEIASDDDDDDDEDDDELDQDPSNIANVVSKAEQAAAYGRPAPADAAVSNQGSDLLTAKNLESQQAQHRQQPLRAADLDEDDENKSQSEFINHLRNLVPKSLMNQSQMALLSQRAQEAFDQQREEDGNSHEEDRAGPVQPSETETFDNLIQWPASPREAMESDEVNRPAAERTHSNVQVSASAARHPKESLDLGRSGWQDPNAPEASLHASKSLSQSYRNDHVQTERPGFKPGSGLHGGIDVKGGDVNERENDGGMDDEQEDEVEEGSEAYEPPSEIDFTVPEPQGGFQMFSPLSRAYWNAVPPKQTSKTSRNQTTEIMDIDYENTSPSSSSSSSSALFVRNRNQKSAGLNRNGLVRSLETQDILNAETQPLDLNVPPPMSPNENPQDLEPAYQSSPPSPGRHGRYESDASSTLSGPINQPTQYKGIDDFTDAMTYRGFSESSIHQALFETSMDADLAEYVLLEERAGRGTPTDLPGIWSAEEDKLIQGTSAPAIKPVVDKHTMDVCQARLSFLYEWNEE